MKVLIAEDNPIWRQMLKQNVSTGDYEPVVAEDGQEAWKILQRRTPRGWPFSIGKCRNMDGIDVCRRVKRCQTLPFTYVVMLTSRDAEEDMVAGLDAGADDYLTKPIEPNVLRSRAGGGPADRRSSCRPRNGRCRACRGYDVKRHARQRACSPPCGKRSQNEPGRTRRAQDHSRRPGDRRGASAASPARSSIDERLDHPNIARIYDSRIDKTARLLRDGADRRRHARQVRQDVRAEGGDDPLPGRQGVRRTRPRPPARRRPPRSQAVEHHDDRGRRAEAGRLRPGPLDVHARSRSSDTCTRWTAPSSARRCSWRPSRPAGENKKLDGRADIYALGIILYVMLVRAASAQSTRTIVGKRSASDRRRPGLPADRSQAEIRPRRRANSAQGPGRRPQRTLRHRRRFRRGHPALPAHQGG